MLKIEAEMMKDSFRPGQKQGTVTPTMNGKQGYHLNRIITIVVYGTPMHLPLITMTL